MIAAAFAAGRQQIKGALVPREALAYPAGSMNPDQVLHLAIQLPVRNKAELDRSLANIYDPKSPEYGHYLTPQEYALRFGTSQADYNALAAFFKKKGFKVTISQNRLLLDIEGKVKNVENTFHVSLRLYKNPLEKRDFYAPDREPSLDTDIPVANIAGLDNFRKAHPLN